MDFSIAYSASVGGLCTIIGNPPNLILNEFMNQQYKALEFIPHEMENLTLIYINFRIIIHLTLVPG